MKHTKECRKAKKELSEFSKTLTVVYNAFLKAHKKCSEAKA